MALDEINEVRGLENSVRRYLGITEKDMADMIDRWKGIVHDDEQEEVTTPQPEPIEDVSAIDKIATLGNAIDNTLVQLEAGIIVFSNAKEMIDTVTAVTDFLYLEKTFNV